MQASAGPTLLLLSVLAPVAWPHWSGPDDTAAAADQSARDIRLPDDSSVIQPADAACPDPESPPFSDLDLDAFVASLLKDTVAPFSGSDPGDDLAGRWASSREPLFCRASLPAAQLTGQDHAMTAPDVGGNCFPDDITVMRQPRDGNGGSGQRERPHSDFGDVDGNCDHNSDQKNLSPVAEQRSRVPETSYRVPNDPPGVPDFAAGALVGANALLRRSHSAWSDDDGPGRSSNVSEIEVAVPVVQSNVLSAAVRSGTFPGRVSAHAHPAFAGRTEISFNSDTSTTSIEDHNTDSTASMSSYERRAIVHRLIRDHFPDIADLVSKVQHYSVVGTKGDRTKPGCIPRLRKFAVRRIALVAAHYWRYFKKETRPLHPIDRHYRMSLECRIYCYFVHFGGSQSEFLRAHRSLNDASFHVSCRQRRSCRLGPVEPSPDQNSFGDRSADGVPYFRSESPESDRGKRTFHQRQAVVQGIIQRRFGVRFGELLSEARHYPVLDNGFVERNALVPILAGFDLDRMDRVAAYYSLHFGPDAAYLVPYTPSDNEYRRSLECLLLCFYQHCGGDPALFRSRFPVFHHWRFYYRCRGNRRRCSMEGISPTGHSGSPQTGNEISDSE